MKKATMLLSLAMLLLAVLQGCADNPRSAKTNEEQLYQPNNSTNEQQQYMQIQRAIYN